jgi:uncharacterized membrane protein YfcA
MQWQFIVAGFVVGTLIGLTGMGGGSLMTPILVLLLGMRPVVAVGTDLIYSTLTKSVGAAQHLRDKHVRIDVVLWLSAGSVPASLLATHLLGSFLLQGAAADRIVSHALGGVLVFVAIMMVAQPEIRRRLWPEDHPTAFYNRLRTLRRFRPALLVVVGAVVGVLVGITSVGSGSLIMVALMLLFPRWKMTRRVGTDVFQGLLLSAAASVAYWQLGTVRLPLVGQLLLGSIPGVLLGSRLTKVVPEPILRPLVAGALAFSGWRLL